MGDLKSIVDGVKKEFSKDNPDIIYDPTKKVEFIPSGSFTFDLVSGGGFPRGRITEVFGMEHSGKTSLLYASCALVQKMGGTAILLDFENAFDPIYAEEVFGLIKDDETFTIFSPDNLEEGDKVFNFIQKLDKIDLIGYDSIQAMKPKAVIEAAVEDLRKLPGIQAQGIGAVIQKVRQFAKKKNCAVVFTNQMRANIQIGKSYGEQNVGTGAGFNPMESYITPGGFAPRFYASLRMKLEYKTKQEDASGENFITGVTEKARIGNEIKIINIKNKVFTPFLKGVAYFDFKLPGQKGGWNETKEIVNILQKRGRISQRGSKFEYIGLNEKWENVGPKQDSIQKFAQNEVLVEDARNLIHNLMNNVSSRQKVLDSVTQDDISPEDIMGQDDSEKYKDDDWQGEIALDDKI